MSQPRITSVPSSEHIALPAETPHQASLPFSPDSSNVTSSQINGDVLPAALEAVINQAAAVKEEIIGNGQPLTDNTVAAWLTNLGMSAYIDNFHEKNFKHLYQLDEFSLEDLSAMKIGTSHRNKIWKALLEFRQNDFSVSQSLVRDASSTSTISLSSQPSISQNSTYCPGYYEVTRYTFKHTISFSKENTKKFHPDCEAD